MKKVLNLKIELRVVLAARCRRKGLENIALDNVVGFVWLGPQLEDFLGIFYCKTFDMKPFCDALLRLFR